MSVFKLAKLFFNLIKMISSKIKKHFSLFMVQKSIKKPGKKHVVPENKQPLEDYSEQWVPKFIDPLPCFHLYGDIVFMDKLNDSQVGLISPIQGFKNLWNLHFCKKSNIWTMDLVSPSFDLDSWDLLYDRLMSLGDSSAYELAKTIEMVFMVKKNKIKEIKSEETAICAQTKVEKKKSEYQKFLKEAEEVLVSKRDSIHFFALYELNSIEEKGLELKKHGYSQNLVNLVYQNEQKFVENTLNFWLFDFLEVEKENYFEFVKHNILGVNAKNNSMKLKFVTFEGISTHSTPIPTTRICLDYMGNVLGLFLLYEFEFEVDFLERVSKSREKKTMETKRIKNREKQLESALKFYYEDFKQDFDEKGPENNLNSANEAPLKRCGFRKID